MKREQKILEVGDIVYHDTRFYGLQRAKIDRVTKTRAWAGGQAFDRSYLDGLSLDTYPRQRGFSMQSFWVASDRLNAKYEIQGHVIALRDIKWGDYSIETLKSVRKILGE